MSLKRRKRKIRVADNGISEILDTVLLLAIAVALFSVAYVLISSFLVVQESPQANIIGYVQGDNIILEHLGGDSLDSRTKLQFTINGQQQTVSLLSPTLYDTNNNGKWDVGEKVIYDDGFLTGYEVDAFVIDDASNSVVFYSMLQSGTSNGLGAVDLNTSVDRIMPYTITSSPLSITATGDSRLNIVELWYRWSDDNSSWNGGLNEIKDPVDSNTCNNDSSADEGIESNFENIQGTSSDGSVMTIYEANQDAGASTLGKTSGSGSLYATINANQMYGQIFTANSSGEIYQATFYGRSSSGTRYAKIVICDSSGHILPNGVSNIITVSSSAGNKVGTFSAGSRPIVQNGQTYWLMVIADANSIRLYYDSPTGETNNSYSTPTNLTDTTSATTKYRVLSADIYNLNYTIDFEYQWTSANYNMANEEVCIYLDSHTGSEDLLVNYWNGSAWSSLGMINGTGWSNFTATGLTSSTYTIQLKGATETGDTSQDSWNIDAIMLRTWDTTSGLHGHDWMSWSDINNPDTSSPWNWSFNFPDGTGYYEFYSMGQYNSETEEPPEDTDTSCYFNQYS